MYIFSESSSVEWSFNRYNFFIWLGIVAVAVLVAVAIRFAKRSGMP